VILVYLLCFIVVVGIFFLCKLGIYYFCCLWRVIFPVWVFWRYWLASLADFAGLYLLFVVYSIFQLPEMWIRIPSWNWSNFPNFNCESRHIVQIQVVFPVQVFRIASSSC
jgi:hypothetical protein